MAKRIVIPFATSGDKSDTPNATDPTGAVSWSQGWGPDYQRDNSDPLYKPVGRKEMNGLLYDISDALSELQAQGLPTWVQPAGLVPPYAINALVRYVNIVWRSTVANNSTTPGAVGASWVDITALPSASETTPGVIEIATQSETDTGTDDARAVTPKKLKTFLSQALFSATESVAGILKIATQIQTDTGADDATAVTPKKLKFGFASSFATNGYIVFPTWLGGLALQWGLTTPLRESSLTVTLPIAYTSVHLASYATVNLATANPNGNYSAYALPNGLAQVIITADDSIPSGSGGPQTIRWYSIGKMA